METLLKKLPPNIRMLYKFYADDLVILCNREFT